jgi:glutamine synthetase
MSIERLKPQPLPDSLSSALELLEACGPAAEWLGAHVLSAYLRFKRAEISSLDDVDETEICRRYAQVY